MGWREALTFSSGSQVTVHGQAASDLSGGDLTICTGLTNGPPQRGPDPNPRNL